METEPFICPVCAKAVTPQFVIQETSEDGTVEIQRCPECGLYVTWPRLADSQGHYFEDDFDKWNAKYGAIDRGERRHDRHQNYLEETRIIGQYVPTGRLLDVGCNAGWLLGYLQQTGQYTLEGVEPGPGLAQIANRRPGVQIHNCYLHELQDREEAFDGITATDVIEHIPPENIDDFVQTLKQLLKPGGFCFIKTPNARFTYMKSRIVYSIPETWQPVLVRGRDLWDAKEHLIHWDARNLARFFTQRGLEPVRVFTPHPIETNGSPLVAKFMRKALYQTAIWLNGKQRVLPWSQDIFLVARKYT